MNVYAIEWVWRLAGPSEYDPHERETRRTDLRGIDYITCSNDRQAFSYVKMMRPNAELKRPRFLGPA